MLIYFSLKILITIKTYYQIKIILVIFIFQTAKKISKMYVMIPYHLRDVFL
jgi:hypothetical protein